MVRNNLHGGAFYCLYLATALYCHHLSLLDIYHRCRYHYRNAHCHLSDASNRNRPVGDILQNDQGRRLLWKKISKNLPDVESDTGFVMLFVDWALGIIMIYAILFGTGKFIFGDTLQGALYLGAGVIAGSLIFADLNRRGWNNLN